MILHNYPFYANWVVIIFVFIYSYIPSSPLSRPNPLAWIPPNGTSAAANAKELTPTIPDTKSWDVRLANSKEVVNV